jgi:Flp pilus assembly protein TadD
MPCAVRVPSLISLLLLVPFALSGCASLWSESASKSYYDPTSTRDQYRATLQAQTAAGQVRTEEGQSSSQKLLEGDRHLQQGDLWRAAVAYFRAARLDPETIEPRLRLAHVELRTNPERAENSFRALTEQYSEAPSAWLGLGLALVAQSKLEDAADALERTLALDPDSAVSHCLFGVIHERRGRHLQAREHLQRALELDPEEPSLLNNLGLSYLMDPTDHVTQNNLGLCVGLRKRYEEALAIFRQSGDEQTAQNNLAYVYYLTGQPDQAIATYEQALLIAGDHTITILKNLRRVERALEERPIAVPQ